jgi:nucleotide-binding universal stress UspA family protein
MTSKILVALDGSTTSESILSYLNALLHYQDADVTLAIAGLPGKDAAGLQDYLSGVADRLRRKGAVVDTEVLTGRPAEAITSYAAGGRFDLLALCSRGKSGLKRLLFGSVAEEILHASTVPVLVVPPETVRDVPSAIQKIVLPLDGSHRSASILKPATVLAKAFGAKLCFVTVVSPVAKDELPVETVAHNLFREQRALQEQGLDVEVAVLYGDPTERILDFAEQNDADLIALSTHGRSGLDTLRFGSVAQSLLRKGQRPLLVVRTGAIAKSRGRSGKGMAARHRALAAMAETNLEVKKPYKR